MSKFDFVLFQGMEHDVRLLSYPGKNTQLFFRGGSFDVYINNKLTEAARYGEAEGILELWLRDQARRLIEDRLKEYSGIIGVEYNSIRIKDTKSRWGSCSSKGNLNFSWRIVMAPKEVMDYVIIHELCHLKHMNHSKEFWETVGQYMPDYEKHKDWLRVKGAKLRIG